MTLKEACEKHIFSPNSLVNFRRGSWKDENYSVRHFVGLFYVCYKGENVKISNDNLHIFSVSDILANDWDTI